MTLSGIPGPEGGVVVTSKLPPLPDDLSTMAAALPQAWTCCSSPRDRLHFPSPHCLGSGLTPYWSSVSVLLVLYALLSVLKLLSGVREGEPIRLLL